MQEKKLIKKFSELFYELKDCDEKVQIQKIEEMNEIVNEMDEEEWQSVFTKDLFNEINKMTEEKKMSMNNAILFLKKVGYCKELKGFLNFSFSDSFLSESFKKMIINEEKKKEEKNENLLVDLCECFISISCNYSNELKSICVPCLLKVALKKEGNEENVNEVEMTLLALSGIHPWIIVKSTLFLMKITEIIKCHQEHCNLTRLAYQSAWKFLISRLSNERSLEEVIVNELHFVREATKELKELIKYVDFSKTEKDRNEMKCVWMTKRWLEMLDLYLSEESTHEGCYCKLIECVVRICGGSKLNCEIIIIELARVFASFFKSANVYVEDLLKSGSIDTLMDMFQQNLMEDIATMHYTKCLISQKKDSGKI